MKKLIIVSITFCLAMLTSCSLDPTLADKEPAEVVTVASMQQFMSGTYHMMKKTEYWGRNMIVMGEVRSDNVFANGSSGRFVRESRMDILPTDGNPRDEMIQMYATTAQPNVIINTDMETVEGPEEEKEHLLGEAYLTRAMVHFDLLRLFGQTYVDGSDLGISYITEFKGEDLNVPRGTVSENQTQIYSDISEAIEHFKNGAESSRAGAKTNFTLMAAYALESRVGTYFNDYDKVLEHSEDILGQFPITPKSEYVNYWKIDAGIGAASIFELAQNETDNSGIRGLAYIYRGDSYGDLQTFDNILEDAEFEPGDVRGSEAMIAVDVNGSGVLTNMGKYPSGGGQLGQDNIKVFRYAEVVLNIAEATLLGAGNSSKALDLLNSIATNRGASAYAQATLENIMKERRKELIYEGMRSFDLQRWGHGIPQGNHNSGILNDHGDVPDGAYNFALPIPEKELNSNRASEQNKGYN